MPITPGDFRFVVALNSVSNVAEDASINTWHVAGADLATNVVDIGDALTTFYNTFGGRLASTVNRTGSPHTITVYDLNDVEPRVPLIIGTFSIDTAAGDSQNLPSEVAMCLSLSGETIGGVNMARRRGRVYLGPWNESMSGNGDDEPARPASIYTDVIAEAATDLLDEVAGLTGGPLISVYSRADSTLRPVEHGWIDNAWDTQRRRGVDSTARTVFQRS